MKTKYVKVPKGFKVVGITNMPASKKVKIKLFKR